MFFFKYNVFCVCPSGFWFWACSVLDMKSLILWNHYYTIRSEWRTLFQTKRLLGKILKFNRAWICLHFFPIFKMEFVTQQRKRGDKLFNKKSVEIWTLLKVIFSILLIFEQNSYDVKKKVSSAKLLEL